MGASYTNIHFNNKNGLTTEKVRAKLLDSLDLLGLKETNNFKNAFFTLHYAMWPHDKWISVYSDMFDYDADSAWKLQKQFAEDLHTGAYGVSVIDSDLCIMRMWDAQSKSSCSVAVGDWGLLETSKPKPIGRVKKPWKPYLLADYAVHDLDTIWKKENIFAEDAAIETGKMLGIETDRINVGWNTFQEVADGLPPLFSIALSIKGQPEIPRYMFDIPTEVNLSCPYEVADKTELRALFTMKGAASKGIFIAILGKDISEQKVRAENIRISRYKNPFDLSDDLDLAEQICYCREKFERYYLPTYDCEFLGIEIPEFEFPVGYNEDHPSLAYNDDVHYRHTALLKLDLELNQIDLAYLFLLVLPLENEDGGGACAFEVAKKLKKLRPWEYDLKRYGKAQMISLNDRKKITL